MVFAPQILQGRIFVFGDARFYRPFSEYSRDRWTASHARTFWNPFVFCGVSASASLADSRPQYLPDAALELVERLRPTKIVPLAGPLLAHLLGMLSLAALAWCLWGLPAVGLVWAGLAYGLSPLLLVPFAFGHDAFLVSCSLMPAVLLAVWLVFQARGPRPAAGATLALALLAGVQALTGHPQVVVYSGLAAVAFAIERAVRRRHPARLILVLLALAWGAAISMAVWWPALLYGDYSNRGGAGVSLAQVRMMSVAWYELLQLAWARAVGGSGDTYWGGLGNTDYPRFLGTTIVAFTLLALLGRRAARPAARGVWIGMALVALLLALGPRTGPLFALVYHSLPFFSRFRVTSMALVVGVLAAALLSSTIFADSVDPADRTRGGVTRGIGITAAALAVALALGIALSAGTLDTLYAALAHAARPWLTSDQAWRAGRFAGEDLVKRVLLLAAALLLLRAWRGSRRLALLAGTALLALVAVDLGMVSLPVLRRATARPEALTAYAEPELARIGAADHAARVLSSRRFDSSSWQVAGARYTSELQLNDWIRWRARAFGGEHGTPPATWDVYTLMSSVDAMRALGIVYFSAVPGLNEDTSSVVPVARGTEEIVYRLKGALSRAYAVPRVTALDADTSVRNAILLPGFDPMRVAFTSDAAAAGAFPGSAECRLRWLADGPDTLALAVQAPAPAFVVVADSYFPGWSATLDGSPVPIRRVNYDLRGVAVPAGDHRLQMTFVPEGWALGVPVTRWTLGLWLLAALAWSAAGLRGGRRSWTSQPGSGPRREGG